jgi:glutamate/tyrosine decarboxylase-like PLP-dependent enzyme
VKNPKHLVDTYSSHPDYYNFNASGEGSEQNFYEYGFQNSRGFRALKVWLMLQHIGKNGYIKSIREDIELSKLMYRLADTHPELEAITQYLSITTFRYVPEGYKSSGEESIKYLNGLNETLLNQLQLGGEVFFSNAVVNGNYCLRACIVNFRTSKRDIEEAIEITVHKGRSIHEDMLDKAKQE